MKRFTVQLENADYSRLVGIAKAAERPIAVEAARLIRQGLPLPMVEENIRQYGNEPALTSLAPGAAAEAIVKAREGGTDGDGE